MVEAAVRLTGRVVSATRYASVLGLGFGDCGKGHFIDAMTRRRGAHTVVRFNGGAQAGHNVVTPGGAGRPQRHHTFCQFGAGTMVPGTRTVLLDPMVLHPTALLAEAEALERIGVHAALSRLAIDARCRVTTPFHQAAGRLRELLRGAAAHGTCGVGVGETVRHAFEHPEQVIRYADLVACDGTRARALLDRLQATRETLLAEVQPNDPAAAGGPAAAELQVLADDSLAGRWLAVARALARHCAPASAAALAVQLKRPGWVLFEGAQGVLLDEWRGFHPNTTWSSITTAAVEEASARFSLASPIEHYGVLRTYLTRHGTGPLPTHDESLDAQLPEPHNRHDGWQGCFRRGHPDAVLLRYAIEAAGDLSGLFVSHLDVFRRGVALKWCDSYRTARGGAEVIERLPCGPCGDLQHQGALRELLMEARPQYAAQPVRSERDCLDRLAGTAGLPIVLRSHGNTWADVSGGDLAPGRGGVP